MRNRIEIALQVGVYYPAVARFKMPVYFAQRIFASQSLPETIASRFEFVLKDRLDDQFQGRLNYAILYRRYAERTPAFAFGYVHAPYRLRPITAVPQPVRQFGQIAFLTLGELLNAHAIHPGGSCIAFDLGPSQRQRVQTRHFVDQAMPFASLHS